MTDRPSEPPAHDDTTRALHTIPPPAPTPSESPVAQVPAANLAAPIQPGDPAAPLPAGNAAGHRPSLEGVTLRLARIREECLAAYRSLSRRQRTAGALLGGAVVLALVGALGAAVLGGGAEPARATMHTSPPSAPAAPAPQPTETTPSPAPAADNLPVITYDPAPTGFPADPEPASTTQLTEGAHPVEKIPVYDAFGGQPKAFLAPTISGVPITMPIVERRAGWIAILLPSANRTIGWLGPQGWQNVALRDHIVVRRGTHELSWFRDATLQRTWSVTLGIAKTPTPLGRTFVLGRSTLSGYVYGGVDVMALGSVPDNVNAVPAGLRGAHIGIHTWYNDATLGKDDTDGCIRLTKSGQQQLLSEIVPGTTVVVVD